MFVVDLERGFRSHITCSIKLVARIALNALTACHQDRHSLTNETQRTWSFEREKTFVLVNIAAQNQSLPNT